MAKTNLKTITHLMNHSKHGVLSQALIMQAVEQYADSIIENEKKLIADYEKAIKNGKQPFVNIYSWIGAAKEIKIEFNKR